MDPSHPHYQYHQAQRGGSWGQRRAPVDRDEGRTDARNHANAARPPVERDDGRGAADGRSNPDGGRSKSDARSNAVAYQEEAAGGGGDGEGDGSFEAGLTLVHFSAQLERFAWDKGCA